MAGKRFKEAKIEKTGVTSRECAFPSWTCGGCERDFVFEDEVTDEPPRFCPFCGRANANTD